jgi:nicotinate-nucleotide pyrophosphorylase (carboxylating)
MARVSLDQSNHRLERIVAEALAEDVGSGDMTTTLLVDPTTQARAQIRQTEPGVLSGIGVAKAVFSHLDRGLCFEVLADEGIWRSGGVVLEVSGEAGSILTAERVALNFLGHLSGIATQTQRFVCAVGDSGARILNTRKTTPGLRTLERQAVIDGGGLCHRFGLSDAVLVKENHAEACGGLEKAARKALASAPEGMTVEVECQTLSEVNVALSLGVEHILLDNMQAEEISEAVRLCKGHSTVEASGRVSLETVHGIAQTGVDYISVGAITHSAPSLDLSLAFLVA